MNAGSQGIKTKKKIASVTATFSLLGTQTAVLQSKNYLIILHIAYALKTSSK